MSRVAIESPVARQLVAIGSPRITILLLMQELMRSPKGSQRHGGHH